MLAASDLEHTKWCHFQDPMHPPHSSIALHGQAVSIEVAMVSPSIRETAAEFWFGSFTSSLLNARRNGWHVAEDWRPCAIGMLPCALSPAGTAPMLALPVNATQQTLAIADPALQAEYGQKQVSQLTSLSSYSILMCLALATPIGHVAVFKFANLSCDIL